MPRWMARLGLIAGPILCAGSIAVLFGVIEPDSALKSLTVAPEFVWELSPGIYLTVKGFKASGVQRLQADPRAVPTRHAVPTP